MSSKEILDGQIFKSWRVIKEVEQRGVNRYFLCECLKCEVNYEVVYGNLKNKNRYFCCARCANSNNLSGQKFGRLLVIEKHSQYKDGKWKYLCKCDCGKETTVAGTSLLNGRIKSCRCYHKERMTGENHYNWKGGVTPENKRKRKLEKQTKQLSKKRDDYTCQKCGKKGGQLESHHVFDFDHYPELQNNIYNFITLCRKCHQRSKKNKHSFHSIYSPRKENTLKDIEDWLGHPYKYRQSLLNYYEYYYGSVYPTVF